MNCNFFSIKNQREENYAIASCVKIKVGTAQYILICPNPLIYLHFRYTNDVTGGKLFMHLFIIQIEISVSVYMIILFNNS